MGSLILRITPAGSDPLVTGNLGLVVANKPLTTAENLESYFRSLMGGATALGSGVPLTQAIRCDVNPVRASGTLTLSTSSGAIVAVINGVSITSTLSSGDTLNAAALAAAINASTNALVAGRVTATSAASGLDAIVTITAVNAGADANGFTTTASGTGCTADQARLLGGTDGTAQVAAVKASGTFTFATGSGSCVALINGQTVTITASGVDATDAAAMATAILASEKVGIRGVVTATSDAAVVTVTALRAGTGDIAKTGNGITTTATGTNFTADQTVLAGGLNAVSTRFTY